MGANYSPSRPFLVSGRAPPYVSLVLLHHRSGHIAIGYQSGIEKYLSHHDVFPTGPSPAFPRWIRTGSEGQLILHRTCFEGVNPRKGKDTARLWALVACTTRLVCKPWEPMRLNSPFRKDSAARGLCSKRSTLADTQGRRPAQIMRPATCPDKNKVPLCVQSINTATGRV
ncbi:hypothetical protein CYLTODRAFT_134272 [Cylindrobasidium torrendii FP15055 ss-10]|uniref:Uncharacterized protein n=1 Tax=Cylindrobasidium torrendii FP15055 ss-10 TaxID=1314674 RepID=A0A0D7BM77_9AGAR|nr:hypothetical protein CYLTODRAFT_134272 [Cylindrobasidium torrendii FP15055 ss-10]